MKGMLFDIQHFSLHDGPGIRTTVFLKGCNLRCLWCHNPESQESKPQLLIHDRGCIGCGACVQVCPTGARELVDGEMVYDRNTCEGNGNCAMACYSEVLEISGKIWTVGQVMEEIRRDMSMYRYSGGGVTFSGGEPMLQTDFLESLLKECRKEGIHTAIDTAGAVSWKSCERMVPYTSLFLYDLKCMDRKRHIEVTGQDNILIKNNLKRLKETVDIWIRIPCIEGINDTEAEIKQYQELLKEPGRIRQIELLPYHSFGEPKCKMLGRPVPAFKPMGEETAVKLKRALELSGVPVYNNINLGRFNER